MKVVDGSMGEGGGQILRSSLALAVLTNEPVRITNIRKNRKKNGLLRQHLTAVRAAAQISDGQLMGDEMRSTEVTFHPGPVRPGSYCFSVGTAGSANLVLQTVLPPLMMASGPSDVVLEGGTHNPMAPSFDYLDRVFFPLLRKMGVNVTATLERAGFYPAGGGRMKVRIEPSDGPLQPLELVDRGPIVSRLLRVVVANLPWDVVEREAAAFCKKVTWDEADIQKRPVDSLGPGNVMTAFLEFSNLTEAFTAFGERGVRAERIGHNLADEVRSYLRSEVPVGPHLADQLLLPLALAGGGTFLTGPLTLHTETNLDVIRMFLPVDFEVDDSASSRVRISVREGRDA